MDRYGLSCDIQSGMVREIPYPEGQWVKYSDVEQLLARVRELEGVVRELEEYQQSRVMKLEEEQQAYVRKLKGEIRMLQIRLREVNRACEVRMICAYDAFRENRELIKENKELKALKGGA